MTDAKWRFIDSRKSNSQQWLIEDKDERQVFAVKVTDGFAHCNCRAAVSGQCEHEEMLERLLWGPSDAQDCIQ